MSKAFLSLLPVMIAATLLSLAVALLSGGQDDVSQVNGYGSTGSCNDRQQTLAVVIEEKIYFFFSVE